MKHKFAYKIGNYQHYYSNEICNPMLSDLINEAISCNTKNTRAVALKASIQRKLRDFEGAKERAFTTTISNWQLESENDGLKSIYIRVHVLIDYSF